jgi:flagellar biogenesis protein FliO
MEKRANGWCDYLQKLLQSPNTGKFQSGKAILERIGACFFILALVWVVMWMVKEMVVLSPKE